MTRKSLCRCALNFLTHIGDVIGQAVAWYRVRARGRRCHSAAALAVMAGWLLAGLLPVPLAPGPPGPSPPPTPPCSALPVAADAGAGQVRGIAAGIACAAKSVAVAIAAGAADAGAAGSGLVVEGVPRRRAALPRGGLRRRESLCSSRNFGLLGDDEHRRRAVGDDRGRDTALQMSQQPAAAGRAAHDQARV